MEQNRSPKHKLTELRPSDFLTKEPKTYVGEMVLGNWN
jgi:hypothetical protein